MALAAVLRMGVEIAQQPAASILQQSGAADEFIPGEYTAQCIPGPGTAAFAAGFVERIELGGRYVPLQTGGQTGGQYSLVHNQG